MDAAGGPASAAALGRPGNGKGGPAGRPQLRLVTLLACGTRTLLDAAAGPSRGRGTGERELARQLLGGLRKGMLLLADRGGTRHRRLPRPRR